MKRATLPKFIAPMLAKPGRPFDSDECVFEIKWDGTRALAFIDESGYRLVNRREAVLTERYPEFAFLSDLPDGTVLDGEIVVLNNGKPNFDLLMSREQARSDVKIRRMSITLPATYVVFDLLYHGFKSLMDAPLQERRENLRALVKACGQPALVFSDGVVGKGTAFFEQVSAQAMEGVVAKRLQSKYHPGQRSDAWIKIKRGETVCCAIIGFLADGKDDFRSLLLAAKDDAGDELRYVGKVGTGFDGALRKKINALLWAQLRPKPMVQCKIKAKWIEPGLFCIVDCMEKTANGHLRAPVFRQLMEA